MKAPCACLWIGLGPALLAACSGARSDDPLFIEFSADKGIVYPAGDAGGDVEVRRDAGDASTTPDAPRVHVSTGGIDLGFADCGAVAPHSRAMTLTNAGGGTLSWAVALTGSDIFSVDGAKNGTLEAGTNASITVTMSKLPASAVAGVPITATLAISTSDVLSPKIDIPVTITPAGGQLALSPPLASFGGVPLNTIATEIPIALTNVGNRPITVSIPTPGDAQFGLAWTGAPANVALAPGAQIPAFFARFRPTSTSGASSSSAVGATGVLCGTTPTLSMSGHGTTGTISVTPADVYFGAAGLVDCGAQAAAQKVTIANAGAGSFGFSAALGLGATSPYTIDVASGTVGGNGAADITITPKPIPAQSATTSDLYADTLTVTTTGTGLPPQVIHLHQTARGARLAFDTNTRAFDGVPAATTKDLPLRVTNAGNALAQITWVNADNRFLVAPASPASVPASGSLDATVTFSPGLDNSTHTDSLTITNVGPLCAPLPSAVALSGTGLRGSPTVGPAPVDFGLVDCGTTGPTRQVTIQNDGNAPFDFSLSLGLGAARYSLSASMGTVQPSGPAAVVTITPQPIPSVSAITPNLYGDTLTMTTNIPGDSPKNIALQQTAQGAIIVASSPTIVFTPVAVGSSSSGSVNFTNDGNAQATLALSTTDMVTFAPSPLSSTVAPGGGVLGASVLFSPAAVQQYTGTLTLGLTGAAMCAPLPSVALDGTCQ